MKTTPPTVLDLPSPPMWLASDLHLGHRSALAYYPQRLALTLNVPISEITDTTQLPPTTTEMDRMIVAAWNGVIISTLESVLFLGDVAVGPKHLATAKKLHGKITCAYGNHDRPDEISRGLPQWRCADVVRFVMADGRKVIALHDPAELSRQLFSDLGGCSVLLHGHHHGRPGGGHHPPIAPWLLDLVAAGKLAVHDCSLDGWDGFAPRRLTDVIGEKAATKGKL